MNEIKQTLHTLGLSDTEIKVYLGLLQMGNIPASVLAKRISTNRSTTRYTLEQLVRKRLVMVTEKNNTFYFTPEDPEKILYLLEEEKKILIQKEKQAHGIVGDLKHMMNPYTSVPKVQFYEGVEGVIRLFEDILRPDVKTIYGALKKDKDTHPEIEKYLKDRYAPERSKLKNKAFMIFNDTPETTLYSNNDAEMNRTSLFVPTETFPFDSCLHIYENKVVFYNYLKSDTFGIMIENPNIHSTLFSLFKISWNHLILEPRNQAYSGILL